MCHKRIDGTNRRRSFPASLTPIHPQRTYHQTKGLSRNPYLYSLELAVYGQICLGATMLFKTLYAHHFTDEATMASSVVVDTSALVQGWTRLTWVPILTQAWGGIIVGLVTKHAGGVKKGFSLIAGIALTAFVQAVVQVRLVGGIWARVYKCIHTTKATRPIG